VRWLGVGIVPVALSSVLGEMYCEAGRARVFAAAWLATLAIAGALDIFLASPLGVGGLGLVITVAYSFQMLLLLSLLTRQLDGLAIPGTGVLLVRAAVSAVLAGYAASLAYETVEMHGAALALAAGIAVALITFA